jgi:Arc/MetJ-type ribon-helix-helix transcriptional regulator
MARKGVVQLNVRVPARLRELIRKCVQIGLYTNISEFVRNALREQLAKDASELYQQLFGDATE